MSLGSVNVGSGDMYSAVYDPAGGERQVAFADDLTGKETKGKITIGGVEKTANMHTVTIVTNGVTTTLTLVGVDRDGDL